MAHLHAGARTKRMPKLVSSSRLLACGSPRDSPSLIWQVRVLSNVGLGDGETCWQYVYDAGACKQVVKALREGNPESKMRSASLLTYLTSAVTACRKAIIDAGGIPLLCALAKDDTAPNDAQQNSIGCMLNISLIEAHRPAYVHSGSNLSLPLTRPFGLEPTPPRPISLTHSTTDPPRIGHTHLDPGVVARPHIPSTSRALSPRARPRPRLAGVLFRAALPGSLRCPMGQGECG